MFSIFRVVFRVVCIFSVCYLIYDVYSQKDNPICQYMMHFSKFWRLNKILQLLVLCCQCQRSAWFLKPLIFNVHMKSAVCYLWNEIMIMLRLWDQDQYFLTLELLPSKGCLLYILLPTPQSDQNIDSNTFSLDEVKQKRYKENVVLYYILRNVKWHYDLRDGQLSKTKKELSRLISPDMDLHIYGIFNRIILLEWLTYLNLPFIFRLFFHC